MFMTRDAYVSEAVASAPPGKPKRFSLMDAAERAREIAGQFQKRGARIIIFDLSIMIPLGVESEGVTMEDLQTFIEFLKCWSTVPHSSVAVISDALGTSEMRASLERYCGSLEGVLADSSLHSSATDRKRYFDLIISCKNQASNFPVVAFIPSGKTDTNKLFSNNIHGFSIRGMLNNKWWKRWIQGSTMGSQDSKTSTIECRYDVNTDLGVDHSAAKAAFVDQGKAHFEQTRAAWAGNNPGDDGPDPADMDLNGPRIMAALRQWDAFPAPVPLSAMVEMLTVIWDDEF
jgi:hypothetical protein